MSDLDPIVNITISADGTPLTREGFGTLAIVCAQGDATLSIDTYTSLPAVATDYGTNSPRYRAARAAFSQDPRPKRIKFVNLALSLAQSVKYTVAAASDGLVTTLTIYRPDGTSEAITHTADGVDTTTTIAADMVTAINAGTSAVTASNSGAIITITNDNNGELFFFDPTANLGTFLDETADPGYAAGLDAAIVEDSDFYAICPDCTSPAIVTACAAWAQSNKKICIAGNSNAIELTSGGTLGAALVTAGYTRTAGVWHSIPREYAHVAWAACRLVDPEAGRKTWAYAQLSGVTVDTLTTTKRGYLAGDRWNFFVSVAGRNMVVGDATSLPGGGYSFGGSWIDEVHGDDWLTARAQEDIAGLITGADIIVYDQAGINAVADVLLARMKRAEQIGILLAGSSTVDIPLLADVLSADRQARTLNGLAASAQRASAIHKVADVNIALSY